LSLLPAADCLLSNAQSAKLEPFTFSLLPNSLNLIAQNRTEYNEQD
jgi:hypothetical protein